MKILNMFNIGSLPTLMKSVVESTDSGLELADSSADSNTNPGKTFVYNRSTLDLH